MPNANKRGAEAEKHVDHRRRGQTKRHKLAAIGPVAHHAVGEFRHAVQHAVQREEQPELGFADAQLMLHHRHRQRQVFAHEIECTVTDGGPKQNSRPEMSIVGANFLRIGNRRGGRRRPQRFGQPPEAAVLCLGGCDRVHSLFAAKARG